MAKDISLLVVKEQTHRDDWPRWKIAMAKQPGTVINAWYAEEQGTLQPDGNYLHNGVLRPTWKNFIVTIKGCPDTWTPERLMVKLGAPLVGTTPAPAPYQDQMITERPRQVLLDLDSLPQTVLDKIENTRQATVNWNVNLKNFFKKVKHNPQLQDGDWNPMVDTREDAADEDIIN